MKKIIFSPSFQKKLTLLREKDFKLFKKVQKQIALFSFDPRHPSLRLHKLKGELKDVWSISITMNFRLLFVEDDACYFFDMGTHSKIYKK